jgi:hypothetical protein
MHLIVLHGAVGIWDEVACLAIPATVILGIALAVLREKPPPDDTPITGTDGVPANEEPAPMRGERP